MPRRQSGTRMPPVHPHGRGDNALKCNNNGRKRGSPPRAWGQCSFAGDSARCDRFTPTGVGTIALKRFVVAAAAVHPHGRGDNFLVRTPALDGDGSPPRAWGQWGRYDHLQRLRRFTPTGVGTIAPGRRAPGCSPVHPHGRGDNSWRYAQVWCSRGSPPRAWGQCQQRRIAAHIVRFTPTGVGTMRRRG